VKSNDWNMQDVTAFVFAAGVTAGAINYVFPRLDLFQDDYFFTSMFATAAVAFFIAKFSSAIRKITWLAILCVILYICYLHFYDDLRL